MNMFKKKKNKTPKKKKQKVEMEEPKVKIETFKIKTKRIKGKVQSCRLIPISSRFKKKGNSERVPFLTFTVVRVKKRGRDRELLNFHLLKSNGDNQQTEFCYNMIIEAGRTCMPVLVTFNKENIIELINTYGKVEKYCETIDFFMIFPKPKPKPKVKVKVNEKKKINSNEIFQQEAKKRFGFIPCTPPKFRIKKYKTLRMGDMKRGKLRGKERVIHQQRYRSRKIKERERAYIEDKENFNISRELDFYGDENISDDEEEEEDDDDEEEMNDNGDESDEVEDIIEKEKLRVRIARERSQSFNDRKMRGRSRSRTPEEEFKEDIDEREIMNIEESINKLGRREGVDFGFE